MSGDDRESGYLFQRISVLIQPRYNAVLLHQGCSEENRLDIDYCSFNIFHIINFFLPSGTDA